MRYFHIGIFDWGNAGDTVLIQATEDLIDKDGSWEKWPLSSVPMPGEIIIDHINRLSDAVVIGGGGFLMPSPTVSGWSVGFPKESWEKIEKPIIVWGLGWSQFRYNSEFNEHFVDNINCLVDRAEFFSCRNYGSIKALKAHLKPALRKKIKFQPDATTVASLVYPQYENHPLEHDIVFEPAMDCPVERFNDRRDEVLNALAYAVGEIGRVTVALHRGRKGVPDLDEDMIPFLVKHGVPHTVQNLYYQSPETVLDFYAGSSLTLGMRGHGAMIPFGLGHPFIPIVSHDKLTFFCDDIGFGHGVDVEDRDFKSKLVKMTRELDRDAFREQIRKAKENLWEITQENLTEIRTILGR